MTDRPSKLTSEEVDAFLAELTTLTQKHGIEIVGCGCCGSPWLARVNLDGVYIRYLKSGTIFERIEFQRSEQS